MKVLFVCLGNICRSPLAEAIFQHKINKKGLEKQIYASSCGTANYHIGDSPDHRTLANALRNGVVINHLGRQLSDADLSGHDLVIAMDQSNFANILKLKSAQQHRDRIVMMRDYDSIGMGEDVPDPYYGTEADFQNVFEILDRSTEGLLMHLLSSDKHLKR